MQNKHAPNNGFEYLPAVQFVHSFPVLMEPTGQSSSHESRAVEISFDGPFPLGQLTHELPLKISVSEHIVYRITKFVVCMLSPPKMYKFRFQLNLAKSTIPGKTVDPEDCPISGISIPFSTEETERISEE